MEICGYCDICGETLYRVDGDDDYFVRVTDKILTVCDWCAMHI
jgi:ribosome-binding protein aMBF1 (putative translation factor)